jgi:hypothetical protein
MPSPKTYRWSVDLIRQRTQHLGTVEAPDERTAIAKAAGHSGHFLGSGD